MEFKAGWEKYIGKWVGKQVGKVRDFSKKPPVQQLP
jgi:hypothetical protein